MALRIREGIFSNEIQKGSPTAAFNTGSTMVRSTLYQVANQIECCAPRLSGGLPSI